MWGLINVTVESGSKNIGNGAKMPVVEETWPLRRRSSGLKLPCSDKRKFEIGAKITCKNDTRLPCLWWPPSGQIARSSVARPERELASGSASISSRLWPHSRGTAAALVAKPAGYVQPQAVGRWWPDLILIFLCHPPLFWGLKCVTKTVWFAT